MKTVVMLIVGLIISMGAAPAIAQEKSSDNMQFVIEKIRADKKLFVAENMQLTESEAEAFWPVYQKYQDELFLLRARTAKLIKDYADAYGNMNDDAAGRLLDEFITIETLGPSFARFCPR